MLVRLLIVLAALGLGPTLAMAQERIWNLDRTDQEAYLVFGVPETDDVGISFWCTLGSGIVRIYIPEGDPSLKPAVSVDIELEIASKTYPLKGKTSVNEEAATISFEAELKTADPVFPALREANHFAVKVGASNNVFPLSEADFPSFLDVCKKP
jgi:hypothetical protein